VSTCVLAEPGTDKIQFSNIDVATGSANKVSEVEWKHESNTPLIWALSPDASQVVVAAADNLRVADLRADRREDIAVPAAYGKVSGVAFVPGSKELFATATSSKANLLLKLSRSGARQLWTTTQPISSPIASPDGKRLLLCISSSNSNVFLVDNLARAGK
jgi:hypothetical protein